VRFIITVLSTPTSSFYAKSTWVWLATVQSTNMTCKQPAASLAYVIYVSVVLPSLSGIYPSMKKICRHVYHLNTPVLCKSQTSNQKPAKVQSCFFLLHNLQLGSFNRQTKHAPPSQLDSRWRSNKKHPDSTLPRHPTGTESPAQDGSWPWSNGTCISSPRGTVRLFLQLVSIPYLIDMSNYSCSNGAISCQKPSAPTVNLFCRGW